MERNIYKISWYADYPVPKMILDRAENGNHIVLEISPKFFYT